MIKSSKVPITINSSNKKRLEKALNINLEVGRTILIDYKYLSKGSHVNVDVICDVCGKEKTVKYYSLCSNGYLEKYLCSSCKRKKTLKDKYNVDNVFQLEKIKEKTKKTIKNKYDCEYITQNEKIKEKIKETNNKKYGTEWGLSNEKIRNKINNTVKDRYGVNNVSQLESVKYKKEQTHFNNYGVLYNSQLDNFKENINKRNVIKLSKKYNIEIKDSSGDKFIIYCDKCKKNYEIHKKAFYTRYNCKSILCTHCNPINSFFNSGQEIQLRQFIEEIYRGEIIFNSRKIIHPYELDICLPEMNLAFEYNGLYWHSELKKDKYYHMNKTELCEKNNIKLIHIYEDDWKYKNDIVKLNIVKLFDNSYNELDYIIKEITPRESESFIHNNSLKHYLKSDINIGLFDDNMLISVMCFNIINNANYKLEFHCSILNDGIIIKIFNYFIEKYNPTSVICNIDSDWYNSIYEKMGFNFLQKLDPICSHVVNGVRQNEESESSIKIYNSGNLKYIWKKC